MALKRIIYIICILLAGSLNAHSIETAEQILQSCADKINKSPSISMDFVLAFGDNKSRCTLTIEKEKFRLSSPDIEVWYDGKTQWSYSSSEKEVSITEPTSEELMECNPFAIINNFKNLYTYRRLSGDKNEIELISKNKMSGIRKAVITIDSATRLPTKMIVTMSNGHAFSATVTKSNVGKSLPASTFIYNKVKYPAVTTIDLR